MLNAAKLFILIAFLSISSWALDKSYRAPYFSHEVQEIINQQLKYHEQCFSKDALCSFENGLAMPWIASFALGALACRSDASIGENISRATSAGIASSVVLSPLLILLSLPLAMINLGFTSCEYLINGIKAARHTHEFDREVTLQIYQWIEVIKRGRMSIRKDIKKLQKDSHVSELVLEYLKAENFTKYFGDTSFTQSQLYELLKSVDNTKDTWEKLFAELSYHVKTPALNNNQYLQLEERLINFSPKDTEFPQISPADIHEYLYFAVYFFTLHKNSHISFIKYYLNK